MLFNECFVKGARVTAGIKYSVHVTVTVNHPDFANLATTANVKVSDSATPPVVIFNGPLAINGKERTGGTSTPAGFPNITNPTFPLVVEVIVNNVSLTLSGGSRARIVPATIDSPIMVGGTDWVHITGGGKIDKNGIKIPFKPTLPANSTGDFVEEFRVTDWWNGSSYKAYRVKTFQGNRTVPIVDRDYQLESGFRRRSKSLSTSEFNFMPPNMWGTSFDSRFFKGTSPSHITPSPPFYW